MSSTYSTNLAIELIGTGDQAGTWGTTTNNNLGTLIEQAISGYVPQTITDGADTVITIPNGATGIARNMYIECVGTLTAGRNLIVPTNRKLYFIYNNTTGGYAVTVKVTGQTGVTVPNGAKMLLVCNGTDVVQATNYMNLPVFNAPTLISAVLGTPTSGVMTNVTGLPLTTGVTGTLPVTNGGTGVTTLSGVAYGNGTSAFTAATGSQIASAIGSTAVTNATNLAGGSANVVPYQSGSNTTSFTAAPTIANTSLTWNGTSIVWATPIGSTTNSLTFDNSGSGAATGTSFNGSVAKTISYNTIGAPSVSGTNATGTWGISISGNAATVTNGVYSNLTYADPVWITALAASKITGTLPVTNGGTGLTSAGTAGQVVTSNGTGFFMASPTAATGGGGDQIFILNGQNVTTNYTIPGTNNAGSFGPITINTGVTVTVSDGATWSIV